MYKCTVYIYILHTCFFSDVFVVLMGVCVFEDCLEPTQPVSLPFLPLKPMFATFRKEPSPLSCPGHYLKMACSPRALYFQNNRKICSCWSYETGT